MNHIQKSIGKKWLFTIIGTVVGFAAVFCSVALTIFAIARDGSTAVPSTKTCSQLATRTLLDIDRAIQSGDFEKLYSTLSPVWQRQISSEKLASALAPFVAEGANFSDAKNTTPTFDSEPALDQNGMLVLKGNHPCRPRIAVFEFIYQHRRAGWQLYGFQLRSVAHQIPAPTEKDIVRMSETALRDFRDAVERGNFSDFHSTAAVPFKTLYSPEKLSEIFSVFAKKDIDLEPAENSRLSFDGEPAPDEEGNLYIEGYYPGKKRRIEFTLRFVPEPPAWKLAGINVVAVDRNGK